MKYKNIPEFRHDQSDRIGVLLTNLGTPAAPTKTAVKTYLREFLSDPRVVEFPRIPWWLILNLVILNIRPARSAKAYASIWTEEGSPLLVHTRQQSMELGRVLGERFGDRVLVDYAMRYGEPSLAAGVDRLLTAGVRKLLILPLYPQYSATTTGSTFDAIADDFSRRRWLPDLRLVTHYHDHPGYIGALAESIRTHRETHGTADRLVLSFHGLPQRYLEEGDPYHCECHKTARLVAAALELEPEQYLVTFQSRVGREEWLRPYTDETLKTLPHIGVKSVQVVCPGFSSDCLETLEEIDVENRSYFLESGGESYQYIPCLNAEPAHVRFLSQLVEENISAWTLNDAAAISLRSRLALKAGAER